MPPPAFRVDRALYPFEPHHLEVEGGRMHYVDEGAGRPVVLVHGTPTWSFLYRDLIRALSGTHRVIAPDNIGFGLSDRPRDWEYTPAAHARNLAALIDRLKLRDVVLVVHDFGGPIGLSYALDRPENVAGLVLFNTWMWSLAGTTAEKVSRVLASPLGRFLYRRLNFSARVLVRAGFADRARLTPEIHRHYKDAFPTPDDRHAPWVLARELGASSDWYGGLWERRERIADKPALLLWGMKDPAIHGDALRRWQAALPRARVVELEGVGHFVQEEAPEAAAAEVERFLGELEGLPEGG